jgi:hypothetical protein
LSPCGAEVKGINEYKFRVFFFFFFFGEGAQVGVGKWVMGVGQKNPKKYYAKESKKILPSFVKVNI